VTEVSVILLAAGSGSRFGDTKQFLELTAGVRLVDAALRWALDATESVVLVLPPGHAWGGPEVVRTASGGATRRDSVVAGLDAVPEESDVIIIHDAAHPLAPKWMFAELVGAIEAGADAAVPILPAGEVVKHLGGDGGLTTIGRDGLGLAQLPMAFNRSALMAAHQSSAENDIPDWEDSMLIEQNGGRVVAVAGSSRNLHVVTPEDLRLARALAAVDISSREAR
jgi:2-C-methyl-D-erythritol 4-phosphate cytidylyltransferase